MDHIDKLINDQLDGELTEDEFHQLGDWLRARDENVRQFAVESLIHSLLHDFISQRQVQADALLRAMTRGMPRVTVSAESARDDGAPVLETESSPRNRLVDWGRRRAASRMARRLVTLAAVVLVVLAGATIAYLAMRPSAVAMLTRTANCQWESTIGPIIDGAIFREGDVLHLVAGRALVNFAGGARVVLEGPTVLTVETPSSAVLTHGAITADAPSHAVGFTVDMPLGRLVDLGTEFTLRVKKDQSFELQVFDGLVELYVLDDGRAANDAPLRVSEGVAVKVDAATRKLEQIDYDATQKLTVP